MPASFCGLAPMLFGRRSVKVVQGQKTSSEMSKLSSKNQMEMKDSRNSSSHSPCNFIRIMELRRKVFTFRDIIDLPPCSTSVSTDQLLLGTIRDLHKFYPESVPQLRGLEFRRLPLDKVLIHFCKALQGLGDTSKMSDEWIDKYKYDIYDNDKCKNVDKLVEIALATLNGLIKIAREKFDMNDEDDENKDFGPKANTFGKVLKDSFSDNSSSCPSPVTPTSVLPEVMSGSPKSHYSSSLLLPLRIRAVGKLNPVDVKRLALDMVPKVGVQVPSSLNQKKIAIEKQKKEAKANSPVIKASINVGKTRDSTSQKETSEDRLSNSNNASGDRATDGRSNTVPSKLSANVAPPSSPTKMQPKKSTSPIPEVLSPSPSPQAKMSTNIKTDIRVLPPPARQSAEALSPSSSPRAKMSKNIKTDIRVLPPPGRPSAEVLPPTPASQPTKLSTDMDIDKRSFTPAAPLPPPPLLLKPSVVSEGQPLPQPPMWQPNVEAAQPTLVATEPQLPSPLSRLTNTAETGIPLPLPPPPPAPLKSNVVTRGAPLPPAPPVSLQSKVVATGAPLPPPSPPPPPGNASEIPPPPPAMMLSKGSGPLPLPPMSLVNGAQPPPPPTGAAKSLRTKKANTKLKRSSHMGNLYRVLKGKIEGCPAQGKSSNGKTSGVRSSANGKQGMADALAEMTKRSAYFRHIEEDVEKYEKLITELRTAVSTFNTMDMSELLKFHKHVESILENLTDETQVLARFEGFPTKKLEALRTASALYSKLESMITVLQNWKIEPPLAQLLDKVERYFNKMKGEIDALERTKDEESKKFKSHNIDFDFQILLRIKEAMVDVSSNCMELALKERREVKLTENEGSETKAESQKKGCVRMLWRAFQFAFRVYTFAGGHDDRADNLTRELAHEIQTDPQHQ